MLLALTEITIIMYWKVTQCGDYKQNAIQFFQKNGCVQLDLQPFIIAKRSVWRCVKFITVAVQLNISVSLQLVVKTSHFTQNG